MKRVVLMVLYGLLMGIVIAWSLYIYVSILLLPRLIIDEEAAYLRVIFTVPLFIIAALVTAFIEDSKVWMLVKIGYVLLCFTLIPLYMLGKGGSLSEEASWAGLYMSLSLLLLFIGMLIWDVQRFKITKTGPRPESNGLGRQ